jgi:poly(3-hydroxybutyrate) depolymerase
MAATQPHVMNGGPRPAHWERRYGMSEAAYGIIQRVGVAAVSLSATATGVFAAFVIPKAIAQRFDTAATAVTRQVCALHPHGSEDPVDAYTGGMEYLPAADIGAGRPRSEAGKRAYLAALQQLTLQQLLGISAEQCATVRDTDGNFYSSTNANRP